MVKTNDSVFGLYKGYFFNVTDANLLSTPQSKFVTVTTDRLASVDWIWILFIRKDENLMIKPADKFQ